MLTKDEATTFAGAFNLGTTDVKKIALAISMLPKENGSKGRTVIITQGSDPVVCAENGAVVEFPAEKLPASKIVDTNGAGDAFVGGFLAQYVLGRDLRTSVRCNIIIIIIIIIIIRINSQTPGAASGPRPISSRGPDAPFLMSWTSRPEFIILSLSNDHYCDLYFYNLTRPQK